MKLWWHKLTHWEYWPVYIVYAPTVMLWLLFVIRFKSFHFYRKSNPAIKNGGLWNDSKFDIYQLLPKHTFPQTVLIRFGKAYNFEEILTKNQLSFPLIVKPDIGSRGKNVQQVNNLDELRIYHATLTNDFLIQERCNYSNEMGLFYCRFPNQKKGQITGITLKNFLTVTGDGTQSIEELLMQNPRHQMQIPKLKNEIDLRKILKVSEEKCLVPFGNHNRGTEFTDGKHLITPRLISTFNQLLDPIDGFYYGRLDIRYQSFSDLEKGLNFSIIELNGAKSEPTHIYDPKYSFWVGQKEIFRHQMLFYKVMSLV